MRTLVERSTGLARWLAEPLLRLNFLDRALALGGQAFGALIPLLLILQAAQPGSRSLAADLIERFDLEDDAAETVREMFEATNGETTITGLSVLVLLVSVLSFTRRLQRLYEDSWGLEQRGVRGTGWGLAWIVFFALYSTLHPLLDEVLAGLAGLVFSLAALFLLGLLTPYLLLGRRLPWRRLWLQAALTAAALEALAIWSVIYMPRSIESSASAYGTIGVAFALLTWLWGLGFALVIAAVYGSPQLRRPPGSPGAGDRAAPSPG